MSTGWIAVRAIVCLPLQWIEENPAWICTRQSSLGLQACQEQWAHEATLALSLTPTCRRLRSYGDEGQVTRFGSDAGGRTRVVPGGHSSRRHIAAGVVGRCELLGGSFFGAVPGGGDVYISERSQSCAIDEADQPGYYVAAVPRH